MENYPHCVTIKKIDLDIIRIWRNSSGTKEFNTQFTLLNMKDQREWFKEICKKEIGRAHV